VRDDLSDKLEAHNIQDAARAATVDKDAAMADGVAEVRKIRDLIKANAVTETKYTALGIRKLSPTCPRPPPSPSPPSIQSSGCSTR
jgi:hypothetical protein